MRRSQAQCPQQQLCEGRDLPPRYSARDVLHPGHGAAGGGWGGGRSLGEREEDLHACVCTRVHVCVCVCVCGVCVCVPLPLLLRLLEHPPFLPRTIHLM